MRCLTTPIATVLCTTIVCLAGCSKTTEPQSAPFAKDNVVVILVDTLRADHLPFYGYPKNTAPFLNEIAARSAVFDETIAACSSTAPSTASLFTGVYPTQHGVITGFVARRRMLEAGAGQITVNRIPAEMRTLGEDFKDAGFKTYCLADNPNISQAMGYDQGFDKFEDQRDQGAASINETLTKWAPEIKTGGRYFLYLHYMDPHAPYKRRKPWYEDAGDHKQRVINAYDSEIAYTDEHIQKMFELFGWKDNALVVVLADHGEEFWDHGGDGHGKTLYREVVHVPLFIYHRSFSGPRRISQQANLVDVLPTLAELLNLKANPNWSGVSLAPLLRGEPLRERFLFSELLRAPEHPRPALRAVLSPQWKVIKTDMRDGAQRTELYDVKSDRAELNNAESAHPDVVERMRKEFEVLDGKKGDRTGQEVKIEMNDETLKQLKTLGYVE